MSIEVWNQTIPSNITSLLPEDSLLQYSVIVLPSESTLHRMIGWQERWVKMERWRVSPLLNYYLREVSRLTIFDEQYVKEIHLRWSGYAVVVIQLSYRCHQDQIPGSIWPSHSNWSLISQTCNSYKSYWDVILKTYAENGWRSFFVGLNSTLLRYTPFPINHDLISISELSPLMRQLSSLWNGHIDY